MGDLRLGVRGCRVQGGTGFRSHALLLRTQSQKGIHGGKDLVSLAEFGVHAFCSSSTKAVQFTASMDTHDLAIIRV